MHYLQIEISSNEMICLFVLLMYTLKRKSLKEKMSILANWIKMRQDTKDVCWKENASAAEKVKERKRTNNTLVWYSVYAFDSIEIRSSETDNLWMKCLEVNDFKSICQILHSVVRSVFEFPVNLQYNPLIQ